MFSRLTLWMALCACVLFALLPAAAQTITPVNPTQTTAPAGYVTLHALVKDAIGNPVAGQMVTFTPITLGSTIVTQNPVQTSTSGVASVTVLVPSVVGTQVVHAYAGAIGPAVFTIYVGGTGGGGTPASILAETPTQSIALGGTANLRVRVLDAGGLPVVYQLVSFTTNAPGGTFQPGASQYTDANGYAQVQLVVPSVAGTYQVLAYTGALAPATFTLYVGTGGTPGPAVGIQIQSGNGQLVSLIAPTTLRPLTVIVRDFSGTPVPGVWVSWQVTAGVAGLLQATSITDASGQAFTLAMGNTGMTPGVAYEQATIMATSPYGTVSFVLTTLGRTIDGQPIGAAPQVVSPASDAVIVGKAGQTLTGAIQVVVYTTTGAAIPNVGLDVTGNLDPAVGPVASCTTASALSNVSGLAQCDLVFGRTTGEGFLTLTIGGLLTRSIPFRVTPGDPASIVAIQGDGQSGSPGQTLAQELVAEVRDAAGNPLQGIAVIWTWGVADPAGARLVGPSQVSNSAGRVSTRVTLGNRPGDLVVRVIAAANANATASFTLKAILPVAGMVKVSGDNQTAVVNQAFAAPLVVEVRNAQASPLPGVTVAFAVTSGSATLGVASAVTGSDGRASVTVQAGATAGSITVTARADSQSVAFSLTSRLPGPTLTASSFLNGASFRPGLSPGAVTAIVGPGLAPGLQGCAGPGTVVGPLPTSVANVEVTFGGTRAPIYAVCNVSGQEQVVVQAPWDMAPGFPTMVTVRVGVGSTVVPSIPVLAALPGIFEATAADGRRYAVAVNPDGSLNSSAKPAKKGDIIRVFATGLGVVLPLASTNLPGFPGQRVWLPVIAGIGGRGVRVVSAEYAVNMIGVYEIAIEIPADAPSGVEVALALGVETVAGQPPVYAADAKIAIQ